MAIIDTKKSMSGIIISKLRTNVLNVQDGMDDVTDEQAAGAQSIELWVEEALFIP